MKASLLRLAMATFTAAVLSGLSLLLVAAIAVAAGDGYGPAAPVRYVLLFGALCATAGIAAGEFARWATSSLEQPTQEGRAAAEQPPRDDGPPHNGLLCLVHDGGTWACRYPLGDGHQAHHPYVEGELQ